MSLPQVLAIIPAKRFSSRCADKNLRPLGGVPLFLWTVRAALAVRPAMTVVVSTDDGPAGDEIARLAEAEGASVVRRPPELCRDPAEAPDVAIHALDAYKGIWGILPDTVVMLLPTSPFRTTRHIAEALTIHWHSENRNVVSIDPASRLGHKLVYVSLDVERIVSGPPLRDPSSAVTANTAPGLINGAIWVTTPARLLTDRHVSAVHAECYLMDQESGIDIDTELDFLVAEAIVARRGEAIDPLQMATMRCVP